MEELMDSRIILIPRDRPLQALEFRAEILISGIEMVNMKLGHKETLHHVDHELAQKLSQMIAKELRRYSITTFQNTGSDSNIVGYGATIRILL